MAKSQRIATNRVFEHVAFWLAYLLYQAIQSGWEDKDVLAFRFFPQLLTTIPVSVLIAYINLYGLMPRYYYPHRYGAYLVALPLLLVLGGGLVRYFTYAVWIPWDRLHEPASYLTENKRFWIPVRILRNAVEIFPVAAATMLIKLMRNSYQHEKRLRALEKEKFTAELGLLKAQLNPHFFFNTLNSLYALTLNYSEPAARVVLRLADLMHYMLYEASAPAVLLRDEITHLENYIGLEQLRFADRLDLSFQYSGPIEGQFIAPLLLLPFIENAFKHGLADQPGWITIDLKVVAQRLFLKVANSCAPQAPPRPPGLGLRNVARRLELTYPGRHQLHIRPTPELFEADLQIDL